MYYVYDLIFLFLFAAEKGHKDIIQLLLENGAKIDHQNEYRSTGLIEAGKYNSTWSSKSNP